MQAYSQPELEQKTLKQLKEIAYALGVEVKDARIKANWIKAILGAMPSKVSDLIIESDQEHTPSDTKVEPEVKTCAECPLFQPFDDGSGRGLCCGADRVAREHHAQTQDCLHLIEAAAEEQPTEPKVEASEYTLLPAGANKIQTAYHVRYEGLILGMIFHVGGRTWQCGDGEWYKYPQDAIEALANLVEAPLLRTNAQRYQSPDGALEIFQIGDLVPLELWKNNRDKFYYSSYRDAEKSINPVAVRCDDVKVGDKIFVAGEARIVSDIRKIPYLGIYWTKLTCVDGTEIKTPWFCAVQIAAFPEMRLVA